MSADDAAEFDHDFLLQLLLPELIGEFRLRDLQHALNELNLHPVDLIKAFASIAHLSWLDFAHLTEDQMHAKIDEVLATWLPLARSDGGTSP